MAEKGGNKMNSNIKRAICIVAATAAFTSMFGCTVNKTTTKDGNVLNYSNLPTENGTAVYTFKYKDQNGKEATQSIDIDVEDVDNIEMVETGDITSDKFLKGIAKNEYQMDDKTAKKVAADPDTYKEFQFVEYVQNKSDRTMAYKDVEVDDNGKNGIWIKTSLDAEFTIAPGSVTPIYVFGIADMSKYKEDELETAFADINVKLMYTLVDSAQEDIDWEKADMNAMDIH